jgi:drug/metabolite transporter (DMT)-like permease
MLWIMLALIGAITNAGYFIIIKRTIESLDPKVLTGIGFTFGGLILFTVSAIRKFPVIGQDFYSAVAITSFLNIISLFLIFKSLSSSDLSLCIPMLSFTPVILTGTSFLLLHEVPSSFGFAGICIIVCGSYVLNISDGDMHFLDPVKTIIRNRGSWYMLVVAVLFALSINFDKIALLNSDPFFGMALTVLTIGISFLLISAYSRISGVKGVVQCPAGTRNNVSVPGFMASFFKKYWVYSFLIGAFAATESASVNLAYTMQIVPYVIAIKRLSIIFVVIYGTLVFFEHETTKRLAGAALMVMGAIIIMVFS